jgi:hypothetical protein
MEPVKIVGVKTKNKGSVEIDRPFSEDDDWFEGLMFTVANNSNKTVTALIVAIIFRREEADSRPPFAYNLRFGPSPDIPEYLDRDPNKVITVGKTLDLQLSSEDYQLVNRSLEQIGYSGGIKRIELKIREVGFEDGSMIRSGQLYLQDPNYPNDPTKKIPAPSPGAQNPVLKKPRMTRTYSGLSTQHSGLRPQHS